MAVKIMIDAGHGGYDKGATFENRVEKDDNLELALAVGEILQSQGYDVEYTRTRDVYDSPAEKARIANQSGADFFVSIHRNSAPERNQYSGVQTLVYNTSGIKNIMAQNINNELEKVGYNKINVEARPELAVLRRTNMPAVLVEAGFINSDTDNRLWDTKFSETAEAIASGIDMTIRDAGLAAANNGGEEARLVNSYYGYEMETPKFFDDDSNENVDNKKTIDDNNESGTDKQYQILIGIFRSYQAASFQMKALVNAGYDTEIYEDEGLYQVRAGLYDDIEAALAAQKELRDKGYDTLIVNA